MDKVVNQKCFNSLDAVMFALGIVSCLHSSLYVAFYLVLMLICLTGAKNCIKVLIVSTLRFILSPAVSVSLPLSLLRWVLLFEASLIILLFGKVSEKNKKKTSSVMSATILFTSVAITGSIFNGSYPVISIAKAIAFSVVFLAVAKGVSMTSDYCWMDYFSTVLGFVFMCSFVVIPFDYFRVRNSNFQGVVNQPNMFGILCPIFIVTVLCNTKRKRMGIIRAMIIFAVFAMCFLCKSRTGMFTFIAVLFAWILFYENNKTKKICILSVLVLVAISLAIIDTDLMVIISDFAYKGNNSSVFASRQGQIGNAKIKFMANKILGSGFMAPYSPNVRSNVFSFDFVVEPGNLLWALLGDTGIVGTILFTSLIYRIVRSGDFRNVYILTAAIMINMGEMVFFSTNNIAVFVYFLIAVYMNDSSNLRIASYHFED